MDPNSEIGSLRMQVAVLSLALFILVGFQTYLIVQTRGNLVAARAAQDQPTRQSLQVRQQLDALAAGTARLSVAGDQNATKIVEDFRRQGVTFNFPPQPQPQPQR
jgi:hypothetical protein